jgi:hypothetical protein
MIFISQKNGKVEVIKNGERRVFKTIRTALAYAWGEK